MLSGDLKTKGCFILKTFILIMCFFIAGNLMGNFYLEPSETTGESATNSINKELPETKTNERFKVFDRERTKQPKVRIISDLKDLDIYIPKNNVFKLENVPNVKGTAPPPGVYKFDEEDAFLSSAYIDFRFATRYIRTFILHRMEHSLEVYCHVKCTDGATVSINSSQEDIYPDWPENNVYVATGYFCDLPASIKTLPSDVEFSLKQNGKRLSIKLIPVAPELIGAKDRNKNVGACIKSITGSFPAAQMAEWTEFHKLIGVNMFTFYNASLSGKGNDLLHYYVKEHQAKIYQFPLMEHVLAYEQKKQALNKGKYYSIQQQLYLMSIQDCLYRLINNHKYILLIDMDELLTPYHDEPLLTLVERAWTTNTISAGVMFGTGWYFDDFQQNKTNSQLKMVTRFRRTEIQKDNQPKSVINTDKFLMCNWHGVVSAPPSIVPYNFLSNIVSYKNYGYIHHFRGPCIEKFYSQDCEKMLKKSVQDNVLRRYVPAMETNFRTVKEKVKF